jgi:hypothetical protein
LTKISWGLLGVTNFLNNLNIGSKIIKKLTLKTYFS